MAFQYQPPTGALSGVSFENQTTTFLDQLQGAISSNTQSLASQLQRIVSLENTVAQLPDMDNVMTLNTVQTVTAIKKYTSTTEIASEVYFRGTQTQYKKGDEAPESNLWQNYIVGLDGSGTTTIGRLSLIAQCIRTTGENSLVFSVCQPVNGSNLNNTLDMRYPPTGEPYTTINQPRSNPADNEIATVKYVKDYVAANDGGGREDVTLDGWNAFSGKNTFSYGKLSKNDMANLTSGLVTLELTSQAANPDSGYSPLIGINFNTKTAMPADLTYAYSSPDSNTPRKFYMQLKNVEAEAPYPSKYMGLRYNSPSNGGAILAYAPQPNETPEDDEIATVQWVKENACVSGNFLQVIQSGLVGDSMYTCDALPANGTLYAKGSNATSNTTQGIIIYNNTSGYEQGMYLPPTWTTGVCMHFTKGQKATVRFTSASVTAGVIYWIADKGELNTAPVFTKRT